MTTTRTKLRTRARMLRTLSGYRAWMRDGYILQFTHPFETPVDAVMIYRKGTDDMCLFGMHADDPFHATGIGEDEAAKVVQHFLELSCELQIKSPRN